jgi:hypothetical protein
VTLTSPVLLVLLLAASPSATPASVQEGIASPAQSAADLCAAALRAWATALEAAFVDDRRYPEAHDIRALASRLRAYWESPVVLDPWGRRYRCLVGRGAYRVWSLGPDGRDGTGDGVQTRGEAPTPVSPLKPAEGTTSPPEPPRAARSAVGSPPTVNPLPEGTALVIGASVSITGTGFSEVAGDNLICFDGGVCIHPDHATPTQLDFTVPPSALSGSLTVTVGLPQSGTDDSDVHLE